MEQIDINRTIDTPDGPRDVSIRETRRWISPGRVIGFFLGVFLALVGFMTLVKTGVDSSLETPVTSVLGMTHSAAVGLMELAAGILLISAAATEATRSLMGFVGGVMLATGIIGGVSTAQLQSDIGFSTETAWFFALGGVIAIVAMLLPAVWSERIDRRDFQGTTHSPTATL